MIFFFRRYVIFFHKSSSRSSDVKKEKSERETRVGKLGRSEKKINDNDFSNQYAQ